MSSEKYDLDYPAFAIITKVMGMTDVDLIKDLATLKQSIEDMLYDGTVVNDDIIYVCEIKDIIIPDLIDYTKNPIYSNQLCPDDGHPLIYDESEECYFCEKCDRYYYDSELRAAYNY